MNLIMDEKPNRLTIEHVNSLLSIQLNGPPLPVWKPLEYCKSRLLHHHSADNIKRNNIMKMNCGSSSSIRSK